MKKLLSTLFAFSFAFSSSAFASESEDFVLKFRGIFNMPNGKLTSLPPQKSANSVSVGKMVSNAVGGEVAISMHLTDQIAGEFASGFTLYRTKQSAIKSMSEAYASGSTIGKKKDIFTVPNYLSLQFHLAPYGAIRPYVGGGYHYTFIQQKASQYKLTNGSGPMIQAGVDFVFRDDTYLNFDIKQYFLKSKVKFNKGFITDQNGQQVTPNMKLDPISVGLGIGFKL
jgi:outer membrane protein